MNDFIESRPSLETQDKCYEYKNVSICMIDIVGFSAWCAKYSAKDIVQVMKEYNNTLTSILKMYSSLTKIELVGDSCMIIGGMNQIDLPSVHVVQMIHFCVDLLNSDISFNSEKISVRIGIHLGDVFGTFITHPFKFQLFGNDINTTSRLESSSFPRVIHISNKAYAVLSSETHLKGLDYGNMVPKQLKGVGEVDCAFLTVKKGSILIIEDLKICQMVLSKILKRYTLEMSNDMDTGIQKMKENIYECVLMDTYFESETIFARFTEFRRWETLHRKEVQKVVAVTVYPEMDYCNNVLFNHIISKNELYKLHSVICKPKKKISLNCFSKVRSKPD